MKYFVPDFGEKIEDAEELKSVSERPDDFAEDAGRDIQDNRDGWECHWPITIAIVLDDGSVQMFTVHKEWSPTFTAYAADEGER